MTKENLEIIANYFFGPIVCKIKGHMWGKEMLEKYDTKCCDRCKTIFK